jgi:hypothetical protein
MRGKPGKPGKPGKQRSNACFDKAVVGPKLMRPDNHW